MLQELRTRSVKNDPIPVLIFAKLRDTVELAIRQTREFLLAARNRYETTDLLFDEAGPPIISALRSNSRVPWSQGDEYLNGDGMRPLMAERLALSGSKAGLLETFHLTNATVCPPLPPHGLRRSGLVLTGV